LAQAEGRCLKSPRDKVLARQVVAIETISFPKPMFTYRAPCVEAEPAGRIPAPLTPTGSPLNTNALKRLQFIIESGESPDGLGFAEKCVDGNAGHLVFNGQFSIFDACGARIKKVKEAAFDRIDPMRHLCLRCLPTRNIVDTSGKPMNQASVKGNILRRFTA
jgi:hypothetical protein